MTTLTRASPLSLSFPSKPHLAQQGGCCEDGPAGHVLLLRVADAGLGAQQDALEIHEVCGLAHHLLWWRLFS